MKLPFWKLHGAGNDFILFDDRAGRFPLHDADWRRRLCSRRTGIGSDGIILLQHSDKADLRMLFFNPDGRAADLCGNGARCAARLARDLGMAGDTMRMETGAGIVEAVVNGALVRLGMPAPRDWRLHRRLCLDGVEHGYHFVNTGVPHAVLFPDTPPDAAAVHAVGARVRQHADFAPQGTNVDFVTVLGPSEIAVRTYERGVEAETLACGSGITASALVAGRLGRVAPPVSVRSAGGDRLTVDFELLADGAAHVSLLGPAVQVYTGEVSRS